MRKSVFLIFLLLTTALYPAFSQDEVTELKERLSRLKGEEKVDALNRLCWKLRNYDARQALNYGLWAVDYADSIGYEKGLTVAYGFSGVVFRNLGNYADAFAYYKKGLDLSKKINFEEQRGYGNINLANLYIYQNDPEKSLQHLEDAQKVAEKINNKGMLAYVYVNYGRAYTELRRFEEAESNLRKALRLRQSLDDQEKAAVVLKYIGDARQAQGQLDSAIHYYQLTLAVEEAQNDRDLIADASNQMANLYLAEDRLEEAEKWAQESLRISKEVGSKFRIKEAYLTLEHIAERKTDYQALAEYRKQVNLYKDSLFNSELTRQIANIEASAARQRQKAQLAIQEAETKRQKTFRNGLIAVLILAAILIGFLFFANKRRRDANFILQEKNEEIQAQHEELQQYSEEVSIQRDNLKDLNDQITEKQQEIMSSIAYAERIQAAVLPAQEEMAANFKDYFVLNKPRDIVSGDFYWIGKQGNKTFFAVADCTGHGVPGAFLSMLSVAFLNQLLVANTEEIESGTFRVGQLLDQLRDKIKESLHQKIEETDVESVKDGLDISLCMLDRETMKLHFTGAFSTALLVQEKGKKLISLRGDRMPVGVYPKEKPFQTETFEVAEGDRLYLFSDGYIDQMGGEEGRKFLLARLKKMILEHVSKPMQEQHEWYEKRLKEWRGKEAQVDDVLLVGVQL